MAPTDDQLAIIVHFEVRSGLRDEFAEHVAALVERMAEEDTFVDAVVHHVEGEPDQLVLHETWAETDRAAFTARHRGQDYREAFAALSAEYLSEPRQATFLSPVHVNTSGRGSPVVPGGPEQSARVGSASHSSTSVP